MVISIITVSYNAGTTIEKTIQSVINQTYKDIEYIVVDGGSKDNTREILQYYHNHITKSISESDNGIYDAMNKGIKMATGDIVGILNADDVFGHDQVLENVVNTFKSEDCEALYGDLYYMKGEKIFRKWISGQYNINNFRFGWMPPHPTFFVKREMYEKYGYFNTNFKISADYELMLRFLYMNKIKCVYLPQILIKMSVGGESNRSLFNRLIANQEDKKAWKVNRLRRPFFTTYLKPLRKLGQFLG